MQYIVYILLAMVAVQSVVGFLRFGSIEAQMRHVREKCEVRVQSLHNRLYTEGEERAKLRKRLAQAETKIRRLQSRNSKPF